VVLVGGVAAARVVLHSESLQLEWQQFGLEHVDAVVGEVEEVERLQCCQVRHTADIVPRETYKPQPSLLTTNQRNKRERERG